MSLHHLTRDMYRAGDAFENAEWVAKLDRVADRLDLDAEARSSAEDLFLSGVPEEERSKRAALAAAVYAGSLVAGDQRSQTAVAEAADVSRQAVQSRWKDLLADAGLEPPSW
ncbi:cyclin [Halarchaeum nitratireducens]|uniref:Cyclin n=2 Tax=Halarchaeum nitratireducens TaxID=489913 RepID=A0A830GBK6_9EURY|nr:cyclin [Halarchaeum nitratireducens]